MENIRGDDLKAVVVDGRYNSISFGQVVEVEKITTTYVRFKGSNRIYEPRVCAYIDDDGTPITIQDAVRITKKKKY